MKKAISILMAVFMTFAITACGNQGAENTSSTANTTSAISNETTAQPTENTTSTTALAESADPTQEDTSNVLVAYFSCTGTTKELAEYISDGLNSDLYEITPESPYTDADLDYSNDNSRSTQEMNDPNVRPAISGSVKNMEQYDIIFVGYPIWWGDAPRILSTFMESYDFSGKTIVPFCTFSSSGIGSSATNLESLTSGATWLSGERFGGGNSRSEMVSWVNGLGLNVTAK